MFVYFQMDFKNILEGARPFFQGLPQPLSQSNSEPTPANVKEKESPGNHNQTFHPSVITNHNSSSGTLNRNGSNVTLPYNDSHPISNETPSDGSMNNNNNNNKSDKDPSSGSRKTSHSVNNISPSAVSQNTGKSTGAGTPTHPLLHGGFNTTHPQRSSSGQSHVPIHVPLTIPLPTHHQVNRNTKYLCI